MSCQFRPLSQADLRQVNYIIRRRNSDLHKIRPHSSDPDIEWLRLRGVLCKILVSGIHRLFLPQRSQVRHTGLTVSLAMIWKFQAYRQQENGVLVFLLVLSGVVHNTCVHECHRFLFLQGRYLMIMNLKINSSHLRVIFTFNFDFRQF